nr:transcriptional repressor scratch 2-like isoform X12 [Dermacentor andersoni]
MQIDVRWMCSRNLWQCVQWLWSLTACILPHLFSPKSWMPVDHMKQFAYFLHYAHYTSPTVVLRTRQRSTGIKRGVSTRRLVFVPAGRRAPVMASGVRQLPCPYCPMRFKRRWNLNMHVHTHTGERPYQCCYCFRAFADRSNMRKHILIHTCKQPMA